MNMNLLTEFTDYSCLASIMDSFKTSSLPGQVIVLGLLIGSVLVWSVMIVKYLELVDAQKTTKAFIAAFRKEEHPVSLFLKRQRYESSPLNTVYEHACNELSVALESRGAQPEDLFMGGVGTPNHKLSELHISAIRNVSERTVSDLALLLEERMGLLATATTTAPFLGLLGTVWGVMESFEGMASQGAAMLSAVAPGISAALLTTIVGLLVALPSSVGYNVLSDMIRRLTVQMDNFSQELTSEIERNYL